MANHQFHSWEQICLMITNLMIGSKPWWVQHTGIHLIFFFFCFPSICAAMGYLPELSTFHGRVPVITTPTICGNMAGLTKGQSRLCAENPKAVASAVQVSMLDIELSAKYSRSSGATLYTWKPLFNFWTSYNTRECFCVGWFSPAAADI